MTATTGDPLVDGSIERLKVRYALKAPSPTLRCRPLSDIEADRRPIRGSHWATHGPRQNLAAALRGGEQ